MENSLMVCQSSGSAVKRTEKGVMLTRLCAVLAGLKSHRPWIRAWAYLAGYSAQESHMTAVKQSTRLCSHVGSRLGEV